MNAETPDFAAEAEQLRQRGDALAAVRVAEAGLTRRPDDWRGRVVLALARIDLGDVLQARDELAAALPLLGVRSASAGQPVREALDGALEDDELETAFAEAESDPSEMMDANTLVEQTLRAAELDGPEPDFDLSSHPTYATESMAALLDSQGRRAEAEAVRQALATGRSVDLGALDLDGSAGGAGGWAEASVGPDHAKRLRVVATLESWLYNLRRDEERDPRLRGAGGAA